MAKSSESDVWDQDPSGSGRAGSTFVKRTANLKQAANAKFVRDDWDDDDDEEEEEERDGDEEKGWDGNAKASARTKNDGTAPSPRPLRRREKESEERQGEEDSSKIWEEANKRTPMPELIVASASTGQSLAPPPPAALQPTLRILKRPSPNASANNVASSAPLTSSSPGPTSGSGSGSGMTSPALRGTLAEREAQYQEARSRIFGEKEKLGGTTGHACSGSMSRTTSISGGVVIARDPLGPASESELDPGVGGKAHGPGRPAKGFGERRRGRK